MELHTKFELKISKSVARRVNTEKNKIKPTISIQCLLQVVGTVKISIFAFRVPSILTMPGNILSEQVICELSNDQKYLYNIAKATENEPKCFPTSLVDLNPGTIHRARWLTRATRILRPYVSTLNPSFEFLRIVSYIMNVHIPFWFYFKQHPYCFQGNQICSVYISHAKIRK